VTRSRSRRPAPQQSRERFNKRLVIDQSIGETIGLDGLARLGERQMLLRQDALGAEHHFHVVEPLGKPQQELDAARKGDGLECRKAGEQILPARFFGADQFGTKDRQRLPVRLQPYLGKKIIRDDCPPLSIALADQKAAPGLLFRLSATGRMVIRIVAAEIASRMSPRPGLMPNPVPRRSSLSLSVVTCRARAQAQGLAQRAGVVHHGESLSKSRASASFPDHRCNLP